MFVLFVSRVAVKTGGVILLRRVILSGDLRVHKPVDTPCLIPLGRGRQF